MNWNILAPIISAIGGFVLGLATPIIKWEIEKRSLKRKERKEFIKQVRDLISKNDTDLNQFTRTVIYSKLRPHLSEKIIKKLEFFGITTVIHIGGRETELEPQLLDEVTELEKKWNLI